MAFYFHSFFGKDQYKINLVSQSVNSVIVDFELEKYKLININKNSSDSYQKLMVEGGVSTLIKGEPELLNLLQIYSATI